MPELTEIKVALKCPQFLEVEGKWKPDKKEREAAWELYVELVTRVPIAELQADEGSLRETLSSLHSLFETTRRILKSYGPAVAKPRSGSDYSFGALAVMVLNCAVRPTLARWHPLLMDHEATRKDGVSAVEHERKWDRAAELREELAGLRDVLLDYADSLAQAAEVPTLVYEPAGRGSDTEPPEPNPDSAV